VPTHTSGRANPLHAWTAAFGLASLVLFIGAVVVVGSASPSGSVSSPGAGFKSHLGANGAAAYLFGLAGLAFLVFSAGLRAILKSAEGEPGWLSNLAFAGGAIYSFYVLLSSYWIEMAVDFARDQHPVPMYETGIVLMPSMAFRATVFDPEWTYPCVAMLAATGLVAWRTRAHAWCGTPHIGARAPAAGRRIVGRGGLARRCGRHHICWDIRSYRQLPDCSAALPGLGCRSRDRHRHCSSESRLRSRLECRHRAERSRAFA